MVLWNSEGLNYVLSCNAYEYLKCFDIFMLTETFHTSSLEVSGFYTYESFALKPQRGRPIGGIVIGVKPALKGKLISASDNHVVVETADVNLVCCYYNPKCDIIDIVDDLVTLMLKLDLNKRTIIGGDFNARIDRRYVDKTDDLIDCMADFGLLLRNDRDELTYMS